MATRKRVSTIFWVTIALLVLVSPIVVIVVIQERRRSIESFALIQEFSQTWKATPDEERYRLLKWLLGREPRRHDTYPVGESKLNGLTRDDVLKILGMPDVDAESCIYYDVGSIEFDLGTIVPKRDDLCIEFDEDGNVAELRTSS